MAGLTHDQEDTLLSVLAEADRYIRTTPTAAIEPDVVRRLLDEAYAQLAPPGSSLGHTSEGTS